MKLKELLQIIKKDIKTIGLIALFDILFVLLFLNMRFLYTKVNAALFVKFYMWNSFFSISSLIITILIESIVVISAYSFFKYLVLNNITSIFSKKEKGFSNLFSFIKLNWIIGIPVVFLYFIIFIFTGFYFNSIITQGSVTPSIIMPKLLLFTVFLLALFIYIYNVLSISQLNFIKTKNIWVSIKHSLKLSLRIKNYSLFLNSLIIILIAIGLVIIYNIILKNFLLGNIYSIIKYKNFNNIAIWVFISLVTYIVLIFNRIEFYVNVNGKKK